MKKKKVKSSGNKSRVSEFDSSEDYEDLMSMNREELAEVGQEIQVEAQHSQAEMLARKISKMLPDEQMQALNDLRRQDVFLFETVEYLLPRLKKK